MYNSSDFTWPAATHHIASRNEHVLYGDTARTAVHGPITANQPQADEAAAAAASAAIAAKRVRRACNNESLAYISTAFGKWRLVTLPHYGMQC